MMLPAGVDSVSSCPFCGEKSRLVSRGAPDAPLGYRYISCERCGAHGPRVATRLGEGVKETDGRAWTSWTDRSAPDDQVKVDRPKTDSEHYLAAMEVENVELKEALEQAKSALQSADPGCRVRALDAIRAVAD